MDSVCHALPTVTSARTHTPAVSQSFCARTVALVTPRRMDFASPARADATRATLMELVTATAVVVLWIQSTIRKLSSVTRVPATVAHARPRAHVTDHKAVTMDSASTLQVLTAAFNVTLTAKVAMLTPARNVIMGTRWIPRIQPHASGVRLAASSATWRTEILSASGDSASLSTSCLRTKFATLVR